MIHKHKYANKALRIFPILLVLYEVATYLSNDAYLPALPHIARDLNTSHHLVQLTLTTWFLGSASMQLILGPVSDRYGRRPVLLIGVVVFIVSTIVCALTPSIDLLLFARFIQGATITSMIVAGYATIHELFDRERAIHTLALMRSVTVLAPAFGPLFGAMILYFLDWRWIFAILAIMALIVLFGLISKMPETNPKENRHPINIKRILGQYKRIFTNLQFMRAALSSCILFGAMAAWIAAGPFLVIDKFHYGVFGFVIFQAIVFGCFIIGTRLVKPLMKRYKIPSLIKFGLTCALCGGVLSLLLAVLLPQILYGMIISLMLVAGGTGLCYPILNRVAIEASTEPMGTRMAVFSSLTGSFGMIGSGLISSVYNGTLLSLSVILISFTIIAFLLMGIKQ